MDNKDELNIWLVELEKLSKNPNLDTLEKRRKQSQVFLSNGSGKSEPYKELMSGITATSMQLQHESKEQGKSLDDIIKENNDLDDKQKELLISYTKDLEYLLPIGAAGGEILPLLFDENTIQAIKFWGLLALAFASSASTYIKVVNSLIDTKTKHHNLNKAKNEAETSKAELEIAKLDLEITKIKLDKEKNNILEK